MPNDPKELQILRRNANGNGFEVLEVAPVASRLLAFDANQDVKAVTPEEARDIAGAAAKVELKSANFTVEVNRDYKTNDDLEATLPVSAVEGDMFQIYVLGGTTTVNGVGYTEGITVRGQYVGGGWEITTNVTAHADTHAPDGSDSLAAYYASLDSGLSPLFECSGPVSSITTTNNGPVTSYYSDSFGMHLYSVSTAIVSANIIGASGNSFVLNPVARPLSSLTLLFVSVDGGLFYASSNNKLPNLNTLEVYGNCSFGALPTADHRLPALAYLYLECNSANFNKDDVLVWLEATTDASDGVVTLSSMTGSSVTAASLAARNSLIARGWTLDL